MSDKKNVERKALNKDNLENVSGGMVYEQDGTWVASNVDLREYESFQEFLSSPLARRTDFTFYAKTFDTKEEAQEYDRKRQMNMFIWKSLF